MTVVRNATKYGTPKPQPRTWPEKLAERGHEPVKATSLPVARPPARAERQENPKPRLEDSRTEEALGLFQDRYPDMTPHVAWQQHGEDATAYWLECLEMAGALGGGDTGKKSGRQEPLPKEGPFTLGGSH